MIRQGQETVQELEAARAVDQPKLDDYNRYMAGHGSQIMGVAAQDIGARHSKHDPLLMELGFKCPKADIVGEKKIYAILRHVEVLKSGSRSAGEHNVPYTRYMKYFHPVEKYHERPSIFTGGMETYSTTTYEVKPEGKEFIRRILSRLGYELPPVGDQ